MYQIWFSGLDVNTPQYTVLYVYWHFIIDNRTYESSLTIKWQSTVDTAADLIIGTVNRTVIWIITGMANDTILDSKFNYAFSFYIRGHWPQRKEPLFDEIDKQIHKTDTKC
jgi:hypothetical protein